MEAQAFEKYLTERYNEQVVWYDNRAGFNKTLYQIFQWGVIVLAATVPVLLASLPPAYNIITISVSLLLAVGTAGLKTFKFQENWVNYRAVAELLVKEKHYFDASIGDYQDAKNKRAAFVERIEELMTTENVQWLEIHKRRGKSTKDKFSQE